MWRLLSVSSKALCHVQSLPKLLDKPCIQVTCCCRAASRVLCAQEMVRCQGPGFALSEHTLEGLMEHVIYSALVTATRQAFCEGTTAALRIEDCHDLIIPCVQGKVLHQAWALPSP